MRRRTAPETSPRVIVDAHADSRPGFGAHPDPTPPPRLPWSITPCILKRTLRNQWRTHCCKVCFDGERNTKRRFPCGRLPQLRSIINRNAQYWVQFQISIPANFGVEVSTGAGDIETSDLPARPARNAGRQYSHWTSGIRALPNPFHGALCSQAGNPGRSYHCVGCRRRPGRFYSRGPHSSR